MCAIGHRLVQAGQSVLFINPLPTVLVQDMLPAKRDLDLPRMLRKLDNYDLLVIDDLGYLPQGAGESEVLFTLIAERYERLARHHVQPGLLRGTAGVRLISCATAAERTTRTSLGHTQSRQLPDWPWRRRWADKLAQLEVNVPRDTATATALGGFARSLVLAGGSPHHFRRRDGERCGRRSARDCPFVE